MWLVAEYQPVTLFSLKHALATSSGGKSLLVPTPFAIKMALLDAACRTLGLDQARACWPELRDPQIALRPAQHAVVTNLFARILKPRRNPAAPGSPDAGPLGRTIAYREYVWALGPWQLAVEVDGEAHGERVRGLLAQINYLGKRGGFVQLLDVPAFAEELPEGYTVLNPVQELELFDYRGLLQILDDCGPKMTFEHANIYANKRIRLGTERVLHHVVLPYRMVRSSRGYTWYERMEI